MTTPSLPVSSNTDTPATADKRGRTKQALPFMKYANGGAPLFTVPAGVPLECALDHAVIFLGNAKEIVNHVALKEVEPEVNFSAAYQIEMALALVEAVNEAIQYTDPVHQMYLIHQMSLKAAKARTG